MRSGHVGAEERSARLAAGPTRSAIRGSEAVHVSPKAFDLLTLLVERRPRAPSKAELHDHIWPATFVSDGSLAQLV